MKTCAKVNLYLRITGVREDGYHELENVFWPLPWLCDTVEISPSNSTGIKLSGDGPLWNDGIPTDNRNLCWRAVEAYLEAASISKADLHIHLTKCIPTAAGLGGGSSDAAASLLEMNRLFHGMLNQEKLHEIATGLGADVPFFLNPIPSLGCGIGEQLNPIDTTAELDLFLANPSFPVAASWAYKHWRESMPIASGSSLEENLAALREGNTDHIISTVRNDLEHCIKEKFPILNMIMERMSEYGIKGVHVSGSGPTVFGFCDNTTDPKASQKLEQEFTGFLHCFRKNK